MIRNKRGQENYSKVAKHGESLSSLLLLLSKNSLLNQEIFDRIIQHKSCLISYIWQIIPEDAFREKDILEILHICDDNSRDPSARSADCVQYLRETFFNKDKIQPLPNEPTQTDNKNTLDATALNEITPSISKPLFSRFESTSHQSTHSPYVKKFYLRGYARISMLKAGPVELCQKMRTQLAQS